MSQGQSDKKAMSLTIILLVSVFVGPAAFAQDVPVGPMIPQAPFHLSDNASNKKYMELQAQLSTSSADANRLSRDAYQSLIITRNQSVGSVAWIASRDIIGREIKAESKTEEDLNRLAAFLETTARSLSGEEAATAMSLARQYRENVIPLKAGILGQLQILCKIPESR